MKSRDSLESLFEAERGAQPPPAAAHQGWQRLADALHQGALPLDLGESVLKVFAATAGKWAAIGAVTAGLGGLGAHALDAGRSAERPRGFARASAPPLAVRVPAPPPSSTATPGRVEAPSEQPAPGLAPRPSANANTASSTPGPASSFEEELRLIKHAKSELDAGRGQLATAWLDEHAQRFPRGTFANERQVLRILIVCQGGDRQLGGRLAREFARQHARSPLTDRLLRACNLDPAR